MPKTQSVYYENPMIEIWDFVHLSLLVLEFLLERCDSVQILQIDGNMTIS